MGSYGAYMAEQRDRLAEELRENSQEMEQLRERIRELEAALADVVAENLTLLFRANLY